MIGALLSQIGLPILIGVVGEALGTVNIPAARTAAKALKEVEGAIAAGKVSNENLAEANRHAEAMAEIKLRELEVNISEINETLRKEIDSTDKFVRRMRPTFGYVLAATWGAQMLGIAYVIAFDTLRAGVIINAMSSLSAIWAVGLSVLGVYMFKRSEDKKLQGFGSDALKETVFWNKT